MIILGIETSCDETASAIIQDGKVLSSVVSSQKIHTKYGGVVPEIASREHEKFINKIVLDSLSSANISISQLDAISVTQGPGLSGALLTGVSFAKGLALGLDIPLIPVNHLEAHIFANFLSISDLKFPFICLLVSGGHTQLWYIKNINKYELIGNSRDDAAGEAFDKGAKILGLEYPGGPIIDKLSKKGNPNAVSFPKITLEKDSLDFSFSGLKTSLLYYMDGFKSSSEININDVISSYQKAIIDSLVIKLERAVHKKKVNTCVIAGGVAANSYLRNTLRKKKHLSIHFPDIKYCTDNAAMIAYLGFLKISEDTANINFSVKPNFDLF